MLERQWACSVHNRQVADGFSNADRLPWTTFRRTALLGVMIGGTLRALRWSKEYLQARLVDAERAGAEAGTGEGREAGAVAQAAGGPVAGSA